jgi:hypothetical protein
MPDPNRACFAARLAALTGFLPVVRSRKVKAQ